MTDHKCHTPGPWWVWPTMPTVVFAGGGGNPEIIADRSSSGKCVEELKANARLIAAAPDMLAALKLARDIIGHPDDACSQLIAQTIDKAEGRAND